MVRFHLAPPSDRPHLVAGPRHLSGLRRRGLLIGLVMALSAGCASSGADTASAPGSTPARSTSTSAAPAGSTTPAEPVAPPPEADAAPAAGAEDAEGDDPVLVGGTRPRVRQKGVVAAGRGGVDRIEIPKIGLSHPTFEGIDLPTINRGPSHWPGTARPGHRGNTVFPGHRTTYTRPFWDIDKLVAGDEVIFTTSEGRFTYRVTEAFVVGSRDGWITDPTDEPTFTIFACHPKGSARQRYVVKGVLTSPAVPDPPPPTSTTSSPPPSSTTTSPPQGEQPLLPWLGS